MRVFTTPRDEGSGELDATSGPPVDRRHLARRLIDVEPSAADTVQRIAVVLERGSQAWSRKFGYGPGEGLVVAHRLRPDVTEPLVARLAQFESSTDIRSFDGPSDELAVEALAALMTACRTVLSTVPKRDE